MSSFWDVKYLGIKFLSCVRVPVRDFSKKKKAHCSKYVRGRQLFGCNLCHCDKAHKTYQKKFIFAIAQPEQIYNRKLPFTALIIHPFGITSCLVPDVLSCEQNWLLKVFIK